MEARTEQLWGARGEDRGRVWAIVGPRCGWHSTCVSVSERAGFLEGAVGAPRRFQRMSLGGGDAFDPDTKSAQFDGVKIKPGSGSSAAGPTTVRSSAAKYRAMQSATGLADRLTDARSVARVAPTIRGCRHWRDRAADCGGPERCKSVRMGLRTPTAPTTAGTIDTPQHLPKFQPANPPKIFQFAGPKSKNLAGLSARRWVRTGQRVLPLVRRGECAPSDPSRWVRGMCSLWSVAGRGVQPWTKQIRAWAARRWRRTKTVTNRQSEAERFFHGPRRSACGSWRASPFWGQHATRRVNIRPTSEISCGCALKRSKRRTIRGD